MILSNRFSKILMSAAVVASAATVMLTSTVSVTQAKPITPHSVIWQLLGGPGTNVCNSTPFAMSTYENFSTDSSEVSTLTAPGVGTVYTRTNDVLAGTIYTGYGINPSPYSLPAHTPMTFTITVYNGLGETGGIALTATLTFDCTGSSTNSAGPQVPSGFQLKKITCTTPVYSQPGGVPVGAAQFVAGQSWYVNPTAVKDSKGKSWTEVFDGGYTDGYIPTSCINFAYDYVYGQ